MNKQGILEKTISDLEFMRRIIDVDILDADGAYIGSGTCDDFLKIIDSAIALLKAQEPVKSIYDGVHRCGICYRHLDRYCDNYCPNCGRKVTWNG